MTERRIALAERVAEQFNLTNRDYVATVCEDGSILVIFEPVGKISEIEYEEPEDLLAEMERDCE